MSRLTAHADQVRDYYDANMPAFESLGQGGGYGTIRRAVWAPEVGSRAAAFGYVDRLLLAEVQQLPSPTRVLDLGCGLMASLSYLAAHAPIEGVGVTVSALQAAGARRRGQAQGLESRLRCVQGDFLTLPAPLPAAHLVFSIEAFVHSPSPQAYFECAARQVAPGGTLAICDDFLTPRARTPLSKRQTRCLDEFRHGWVAPTLVTADEANAAAEQVGFRLQRTLDLTPYLELRRPRDRLLAGTVMLARHLPIRGYRWRSLMGGNALQTGLLTGLIAYRFTTWTMGTRLPHASPPTPQPPQSF